MVAEKWNMQFSIITPSYRSGQWLKLCIASVSDQNVDLEHIVQDSCSDDGTGDWLPKDPRVKAFVEKDRGMYDAVNRGLHRAKGEILAYLNCDEQYLPGALAQVGDFFAARPEVEVVFADSLVVDAIGHYLCERRSLVPQKHHSMVSGNLSYLTAATFFRRSVVDKHCLSYNADLRDVGDVDWALQVINKRLQTAVLPAFTSVFTETGDNMSKKDNATRERRELLASSPWWARTFRPAILAHFRLRRLLAGHYAPKPHSYAIYTTDSPDRRQTFQVSRPTYRWARQ